MSQYFTMPFVCLILVITAGLSLPAITAVFVQLKNKRPRNCFYEDVDGYGTPETITRFSNGGVKTAILLFAILGNGISVVILLVLILPNGAVDQILELGLFTGAWVSACPNNSMVISDTHFVRALS